jgi:hypothetical protein
MFYINQIRHCKERCKHSSDVGQQRLYITTDKREQVGGISAAALTTSTEAVVATVAAPHPTKQERIMKGLGLGALALPLVYYGGKHIKGKIRALRQASEDIQPKTHITEKPRQEAWEHVQTTIRHTHLGVEEPQFNEMLALVRPRASEVIQAKNPHARQEASEDIQTTIPYTQMSPQQRMYTDMMARGVEEPQFNEMLAHVRPRASEVIQAKNPHARQEASEDIQTTIPYTQMSPQQRMHTDMMARFGDEKPSFLRTEDGQRQLQNFTDEWVPARKTEAVSSKLP